jgi:hypothetical protein
MLAIAAIVGHNGSAAALRPALVALLATNLIF